jgi:MtrB/PioB family decaheme-associated outer membrane protein
MDLRAYKVTLSSMLICLSLFAYESTRSDEEVTATPTEDPAVLKVDTSRWLCRLCPYPLGWFGSLDFGPGWVSDSSLKFGDYRGLEKKGLFPAVDGEAHYRNEDNHYYDVHARNLGIDSRRIEMRGGRQGRYELRLGYSEIPKFRGHGTRTPFLGAGSTALALPAGWQTAFTTAEMTALNESLNGTKLELNRETLDAGLTFKWVSKWSYRIDYQHQEKNGSRPFGAGVFTFNSSHFPAPVDFKTDQFDMALSYAGGRGQLRFGFTGSVFNNHSTSVGWENPFTPPNPGTETLLASLAPDNEFYQFLLSGAFAPTPKLRLSGRVAVGRMSQDDPFLPFYSINPDFSDLPLPRTSLAGEIDTSTLNLAGKLAARLSGKLDLTVRIKLDERDNRTPVENFTPVITDFVLREARPNRPYSFQRDRYSLELRYRAHRWIRINAGGKHERIERSLQSVDETKENSYWGELAINKWARAGLRLKLESSDRDASPYRLLDDGGPIEHPAMRKFHLADRDRDRAIVELDLAPTHRLGVNIAWFSAEDEYSESLLGLQGSEERNLSLDLAYAVSDRLNLYAHATREDIDSRIASAESTGAAPWNGTTSDRFVTIALGLNAKVNERISLGFDYVLSDSEGDIRVDSGAGEDPFPALETELRNTRFHISYRVNQHWSWKFYAEHEKYDSRDWYLDGLGPDGIDAILTMGAFSPDYSVTVLRVLGSYRF